MENKLIDDTPGPGYLFGSKEDKEEPDDTGSDPGSWMDAMLSHHVVQIPEPGTVCNPDKCKDDCSKCKIFRIPHKR